MSAFLTAVGAAVQGGGVLRAYVTGSVPATPTYPYLAYSVAGDRADAYTLDANHGVRFHRIVLQSVGRSLQSALDIDALATAALLDRVLTATGYDLGPCRLEIPSAVVRDPDAGGLISVTTTLTFTATKET